MSDSDDVLADRIIAFTNELFEKGDFPTKIMPAVSGNKDGFEIETDMGSSFTFEIWEATRFEVARAYYDHAISVYEHMLQSRKTIRGYILYKLGGGYWITKKEKLAIKERYDRLKAWGAKNLPLEA